MSDDTQQDALAKAVRVVESALHRWPEQYKRMLRWRARLDAPIQNQEDRRDDFYAFFVAAYHLADWIKNDGTVDEQVRDAAWRFRLTGTVGLAGDVANGFKHLTRDAGRKNEHGPAHVSAVGGWIQPDMVQADFPQPTTFVIAGVQPWEDACAVADRCIAQWEDFLRAAGLLPVT